MYNIHISPSSIYIYVCVCVYSRCRQTPQCQYYAYWLDDNQRRCALYSSCDETEAVSGSTTSKTIRSCVARLLV